jgi:hypothetical protein
MRHPSNHLTALTAISLAAGLAAAGWVGCQGPGPEQPADASVPAAVAERNADQFLVVDCLLPGKVRKLGSPRL